VEFYRRVARVDPAMAAGLAGSLLDQAIIEQRLSQTASGLEHSREAAAILDGLAASEKPQPGVLDECSRAHAYLSRSLHATGRLDEALQANRKSQAYLGRLMETDKTLRQRYRLAIAQQDEGLIYTETGEPEKGIILLAHVVQEFEEQRAAEPRNRLYQRVLGASLGVLAEAYYSIEIISAGDAPKAAAVHQKRRDLCRRLFDSDPADGTARIDLAIAESESSNALIDLDPPQAVTLAESGLAHWDAQMKAAPGDQFTIPRRARAAVRLARALLRVGRTQPAIARAREAVETFRTLLAQQPDEIYYQGAAVFAFTTAGQTLAADRREAEARAAFQEAASWGDRLLKNQHATLSNAVAATYAFDSFGDYWNSRGDRAQARTWLERSRQTWALRPEKTPALEARRQRAEAKLGAVGP
jgi:tetratricopeptide (TPR) repeat protein